MRSTVRIDDDLLTELKDIARKEDISLTRALNRALRSGLRAPRRQTTRKPRYAEQTRSMGEAAVDLRKALAAASAIESEEVMRKLQLRK